eukprot:scaffold11394_cov183-Amphora_coffeaeformis.AAC.9
MVVFKLGSPNSGIGQVAVNWLALSWISTVILGIPISKAVFGDASVGQTFGFLAGISRHLPFQLLLLECHVQERDYLNARQEPSASEDHVEAGDTCGSHTVLESHPETSDEVIDVNDKTPTVPKDGDDPVVEHSLYLWVKFACNRDVWIRIAKQVLVNPVLWGIGMGFFLSLSTLGPKYLKPSSPQFVPGLFFVWDTMDWLGACVSPLSLVVMGVWMESQGQRLFQMTPTSAVLYMFSKLLVVPLIMLGLVRAFGLNDTASRAAILIAALPISMASFVLASKYDIGQEVLSANIALGTLLMLPTILLWNLALDALDLYPIADH